MAHKLWIAANLLIALAISTGFLLLVTGACTGQLMSPGWIAASVIYQLVTLAAFDRFVGAGWFYED
jgi:hypothetical protein